MIRLRPWLVGLLLGWWLIPVAAVHAQSSQGHAVVLLASSHLPSPERGALVGLLKSLHSTLSPDDRVGVILYSDIVEHVSALAPPTTDEPAHIVRVLNALPAVDPLNTAIGIDRALELLSESPLQRSIIIIGELDVRLENAVLKGRYSRWLEGTLLPTVASEAIGLMVIAEQSSHQGLLQRYGTDTFATMAATGLDIQTLSALALEHVQTRVLVPKVEALTVEALTVDVLTPDALPTALPVSPVSPVATLPTNEAIAVNATNDLPGETIAPTVPESPSDGLEQPAEMTTVAVLAPQNPPSSLLDRFFSLSMAPIFILGVLIIGLIAAGVYYWYRRRQQRSSRTSRSQRQAWTPENHTEPPLTQPITAALTAAGMATEATFQHSRPDQDSGESRFDALIDSLSSGEQETLPVSAREPDEPEDSTIDTRTVDTARKRSATTADMTRELEDLTRERSKQYDFE